MSIQSLRAPFVFPDSNPNLRKGERREVEKTLERAAADGVITDDEQGAIMDKLRASRGIVRDFYVATATKLGASATPPTGLDTLIERMERRDQVLDEAERWTGDLATAIADGGLTADERQALVNTFLTLSPQAQNAVMVVLPNYGSADVRELHVQLQIAIARNA